MRLAHELKEHEENDDPYAAHFNAGEVQASVTVRNTCTATQTRESIFLVLLVKSAADTLHRAVGRSDLASWQDTVHERRGDASACPFQRRMQK